VTFLYNKCTPLTLNTIRACVICSIFYEHFYYCTLYLGAYTLDFQNAALWNEWKCGFLKIKIVNTFGPLELRLCSFAQRFTTTRYKIFYGISSSTNSNFYFEISLSLSLYVSYLWSLFLTKSGTTLRTFRQHLLLSSISLTIFSTYTENQIYRANM